MVQPGVGGLDTPRTNVGDATYLSRRPDFDMSQELSFQSPSKDANVLQQLRDGGRPNLRTPRGSRAPFADRRNLPAGLGGAEFTPLLKSATRNSSRRHGNGKENGLATPAALNRIDEALTPMPAGETSVYGMSRNTSSYIENTPAMAADTVSSTASTPLVMRRRGEGQGPLEEGNHLSLREQENVIDRIEKENFGLKLKIHFLEEALRKAGPGFSEAALRENTELKVDKVTMQRELQRYKKHLTSAEKDLETYRQQIVEVQEKAKKKYANESQRAELERLTRALEDKEVEVEHLQRQVAREQQEQDGIEKLQDDIGDLEADVRRKDQVIGDYEDEIDELRTKLAEAQEKATEAEARADDLEDKAQSSEELEKARGTIEDLEAREAQLARQLDDMKDQVQDAISEKARAEANLEELQDEMANKSVVTKGLSRQVEEKMARLQHELDQARQDYATLAAQGPSKDQEVQELRLQARTLQQERDSVERVRKSLAAQFEDAQGDLRSATDSKKLLQARHDALTQESASLRSELSRVRELAAEAEDNLEQERQRWLSRERDLQQQYQEQMNRLNDEISDLQAECREKDNLYDNDSEKWATERHALETERDLAEERAAGLQRTIDKLREAEGSLSGKEAKLREIIESQAKQHRNEMAVLTRQADELRESLQSRQTALEDVRNELSTVQDELRQSQLDLRARTDKAEALEDEVEILQATIDEESERAHREMEQAQQRCADLQRQLAFLSEANDTAKASTTSSQEIAKSTNDALTHLQSQLADANDRLTTSHQESKALHDRLAAVNLELDTVRAELDSAEAYRDEIEAELAQHRQQGEEIFKLDREKLDLRSAKTRLDGEVRRLREDNDKLVEQRLALEKSLEDEMDRAAVEEDKLKQEILDLQIKLRKSSDGHDSVAARRTIRELERRISDSEARYAAAIAQRTTEIGATEGSSELSILHRDLNAARQKEVDLLQRETSQRDLIKGLKRQVADLERRAHQAQLDRLMESPSSASGGSAQKAEISELRHQLSTAHKSLTELKKSLRSADQKAALADDELRLRLEEVEEQKLVLEELLKDNQDAADEAAITYERAAEKYKQKLDKYRRERDDHAAKIRALEMQKNHQDSTDMSLEERRDLHKMLKEAQIDADRLSHEVREQRGAMDELAAIELSLRKKLERARSERAAYRASAEQLQREVRAVRAAQHKSDAALAAAKEHALVRVSQANTGDVDTEAIIRGAESAERRHELEIRGLVYHMNWIKACWDREARFRHDSVLAKQYLLKEVEIRDACNKADLVMLNRIRAEINPKFRPAINKLNFVRPDKDSLTKSTKGRPCRLRSILNVVRFVVRTQISARAWAKNEALGQRLHEAMDQQEREARIRKMRDSWRAQMQKKLVIDSGPA